MARTPMVTRTIRTNRVNVLCLDTETCEPFNKEVLISARTTELKKVMNEVKSVIDTDRIKAVKIVDSEIIETLYGMPETEFIQHAKELPARTVNATDATSENE